MKAGLEEYVREAIEANEPWYMDNYRSVCRSAGPPKVGWFKITIPRQLRRHHRKSYWAARIYRPIPVDPDTLETIDRWPNLVGEIENEAADYRKIWAFGEAIEEEEYRWLKAINATCL